MSVGPRDVYIGVFGDVHGWGGGLSIATGVQSELHRRGARTMLLGVTRGANGQPALDPRNHRLNVGLSSARLAWRVQSWLTIAALERRLSGLEPPKTVFVGLSMFWVVAAKRVWPEIPAVYMFPCLLSNCLPFTWPAGKPPTVWARADFAGIRRAERLAFKLADRIVTATRLGAEEVIAFHPTARERIATAYFGCRVYETSTTERERARHSLGLHADDFLIAAIGVCDHNKAFDLAIRELVGVDRPGRLVIVGDGPERAALQRLAERLGVAERVHFSGSERDMGRWYSAADAAVSTSFYDTFPNVILEALRAGRPVIVPKHAPPEVYAGATELLHDSGGGLLYDRRIPGALANCLNRLIRQPDLTRALGAEALDAATRLLRWDRCVDSVLGHGSTSPVTQARCVPDGVL